MQAAAEARPLDAEIGHQAGNFVRNGYDRVIDAVERMPEIGGEIAQHLQRRGRMLGDLLGHPVQGIEEKVRVELESQLLELGAQRLGLRAHRLAVLHLLRQFGPQPEVGEAPSRQDEEIMHERDEELLGSAPVGRHEPGKGLVGDHDRRCRRQRAEKRQQADQRDGAQRHTGLERSRDVNGVHRRRDRDQAKKDEPRAGEGDAVAVERHALRHDVDEGEEAPPRKLGPPEQGKTVPPGKQESGQDRELRRTQRTPGGRLGIWRGEASVPLAAAGRAVRRVSCRVHRLGPRPPIYCQRVDGTFAAAQPSGGRQWRR